MSTTLIYIASGLGVVSTAIFFVAALFLNNEDEWRVLKYYAIFAWVVEVITLAMAYMSIRNLFVFHFYTPLELGLLTKLLLSWHGKYKSSSLSIAVVLTLGCFLLDQYASDLDQFDNIATLFECMFFIPISLSILLSTWSTPEKRYVVLAVLFYGLFDGIYYVLINEFTLPLFFIHVAISIIFNSLLITGIVCKHRQNKLVSRYLT